MNTKPAISRVKRSKAEARASYDRLSRWYDLLAGASEREYTDAGLALLNVAPGERVLEIGSGTGHALFALAQAAASDGRVIGLDLSPGMIKAARRTLGKAECESRVGLVCGDGLYLPFARSQIDAIFMGFTLELFDTPEIPQVLAECRRVLRPAGRLCVVAMSKRLDSGWMPSLYEWAHAHFTNYVDCRPIYVREALESAGFTTLVAREMMMFGLPVAAVLAQNTSAA